VNSHTRLDHAAAVAQLRSLVTALGPQPQPATARQIAELLWLTSLPASAAMLPADAFHADSDTAYSADDTNRSIDAAPQPPPDKLHMPANSAGEQGSGFSASRIRISRPGMLGQPRALTRALRPFKRSIPSSGSHVLDEEATASFNARRRHWTPVFTPASDRWLDVTIVVDAQSECAVLWEPVGRELHTLLQQIGAFRTVQLRHLHASKRGTVGLSPRLAFTAPDHLRPASTALGATGRAMTLVLTDGVAPTWRTARLRDVLRRWATSGPTAILQTLPERTWGKTALTPVAVRFRTRQAGGPNWRLAFDEYGLLPRTPNPRDIAIPVLELTPEWIGPWAHAITAGGAFDGQAIALRHPSAPHEDMPPALDSSGREIREREISVDDFRASSQPEIFRLATYLAAAPLSLPVMRTVQAAMLPSSGLSDLAEIIFSGLLTRAQPDAATSASSQDYTFVPGARERLLGALRSSEADEIITVVSAYVARHAPDEGSRFTAAVLDPRGELALPAGATHWAEVHNLVRGRQKRLQTQLAEPAHRPEITQQAERAVEQNPERPTQEARRSAPAADAAHSAAGSRAPEMVITRDGRTLTFESWGSPAGVPVFLMHGTPGSRSGPRPRPSVLYRLGIRLIAYDRPGYGGSDPLPGRAVAHAAADVEAIADYLGLTRFSVLGRSGGAPHALACAALLPERVTRAAVLVGLAPRDADGLDWYAGMTEPNAAEYLSAEAGYDAIAPRIRAFADRIRRDPTSALPFDAADLPVPDRRVFADFGIRSMLVDNFSEALRLSSTGWTDDALSFTAPWGFRVEEIRLPVLVWHGELDVFAPIEHSRWLAAHIPGASLIVDPESAHFGSMAELPRVLNWLANNGEQVQQQTT
jgi:pimeloyl-ACP methyl ester carboxylesterase